MYVPFPNLNKTCKTGLEVRPEEQTITASPRTAHQRPGKPSPNGSWRVSADSTDGHIHNTHSALSTLPRV